MKTLELAEDYLTQIHQLTAAADLQQIHIVPLHLWGGQVAMQIVWSTREAMSVSAAKGLSPSTVYPLRGDTFTLSFDFAPLHVVKGVLEEYSDKCHFDSAHEKAEVLRVYCAPVEV